MLAGKGALLTGCCPPRIGFGSFHGLAVLFPGMDIGCHRASAASRAAVRGRLRNPGGRQLALRRPADFQPTRHGFDHYFGLPYSNDMGRQAHRPELLPEMPPLPLLADG